MNYSVKKITSVLLKYFAPLLGFFAIETLTHGNEVLPLVYIMLYAVYLFSSSKNRKVDLTLFFTAAVLGLLIELGLTQFSREQFWQNTLFAIPLWLPLAWAVAGVVFYRFGKELE